MALAGLYPRPLLCEPDRDGDSPVAKPRDATYVPAVTDLTNAFRGLEIETVGGGDVYERVEDAGEVHRLTGTAGRGDAGAAGTRSRTTSTCASTSSATGCGSGRSGAPLGEAIPPRRSRHLPSAAWPAPRLPGQEDLRERHRRLLADLRDAYAGLHAAQELLLE